LSQAPVFFLSRDFGKISLHYQLLQKGTEATCPGEEPPKKAGNSTYPSITLAPPLTFAHAAGAQVSGSGITLTAALTREHSSGTQVAGNVPTPGAPNQYYRDNGDATQ
jgi:hypothetical protein